jgi:hypothetical protein
MMVGLRQRPLDRGPVELVVSMQSPMRSGSERNKKWAAELTKVQANQKCEGYAGCMA